MALADIAQRLCAITTIVQNSVGWVTKTLDTAHAAGWLPGQLVSGLVEGAGADGKRLPAHVLLEKDLLGQTVHDSYALDEVLLVGIMQPGDIVALRLEDGASVTAGDFVVPGESGDVRPYVTESDEEAAILGIAQADLDLSGENTGGINLLSVLLT